MNVNVAIRRRNGYVWQGVGLATLFLPAMSSAAADEDRYLDGGVQSEIQRRADEAAVSALPPAPTKKVIRAAMPQLMTSLTHLRMSIDAFRIEGLSDVSADAIEEVLEPWKKREIGFPEFELAVHAVVNYLREHGHPDAEVKLSRTVASGGKVAVAIQGLKVPMENLALKPSGEEVVPRIKVDGYKYTGVTLASQEELDDLLKPVTGKALTIDEIKGASETVASHLRSKGYPLVQAHLPPQKIDAGRVEIAVQEGVVDGSMGYRGIKVEGGGKRVRTDRIEELLASGVRPGAPLRTEDLERSVLMAHDLPGIKSVKTTLEPGSEPGSTHVVAKVEESALMTGTVWADNYGSRYTGANRINTQIVFNSAAGYGEQIAIDAAKSSGIISGKIALQVPLGITGAKVGTSYSRMELDIGEEIVPMSLASNSGVASIFGSYTLKRSSKQNIWLSVNFDDKQMDNSFNNQNVSDRQIDILTMGLSGDLVDAFDGQIAWNASYGLGSLDLDDNISYKDVDSATARTAGGFGKLTGGVQRKVQLGDSLTWTMAFNGMMGSKNLDSAEKFQLGGPSGVRAYPVGEGLGDSGWLGNTELRYSFGQTNIGEPQVFAFYDRGRIFQYDHLWEGALPPGTPNNYNLSGIGVGAAIIVDEHGSLRLTVAKKVGSNPNPTSSGTDNDGTNETARVWILGNILF